MDARRRGKAAIGVALSLALLALPAAVAGAEPPSVAEIVEPAEGAAPLNPADVHMVVDFADADADEHVCSDWEIWTTSPSEAVWQAPCAKGAERVHIHLGDGEFVNSYAGRTALQFETDYELRVRVFDSGEEASEWAVRPFKTVAAGPQGTDSALPWWVRPGYAIEMFATGFQLPVNIAMVPNPGPHPGDPLFYVAELYGTVKVVTRDGSVKDYATGLLNFNPTGNFPGSGEQGLAGLAVDPVSGDLFASLVYEDESSPLDPKPHYPKLIRLYSDERGLAATGEDTVLDMAGETQGPSHQISHLTITPAGELYVHSGDGFDTFATARDLESFRGKILRMSLAGAPLSGNPFYDPDDDEITARDYVWAYGFRNPFGGALRLSDGSYYTVENGPSTDRLARIYPGVDYLWEGSDATMTFGASYNWSPAHAPVNIEFVEPARFGGSGFPAETMGHAFVTESGSTYADGPLETGKKVVEFDLDADGVRQAGPTPLAVYTGTGKATAVGLAAGADGLYFTDLYKDREFTSPIDPGANVLRVVYCGEDCPVPPAQPTEAGNQRSEPALGRRRPLRISGFRMRRSRFAVRRGSAHRARSTASSFGTEFFYSLSGRASARIKIKSLTGKLGGTLRAPGRPGRNHRTFGGRIDGRPLPPGRYKATIGASGDDGRRASPREVRFEIVGGG